MMAVLEFDRYLCLSLHPGLDNGCSECKCFEECSRWPKGVRPCFDNEPPEHSQIGAAWENDGYLRLLDRFAVMQTFQNRRGYAATER